jgi:dihydroxyacetone kinase-like predicted kinase
MAADEAARLSAKHVVVAPSESQQEALAVLPEVEAGATAEANAERLAAALTRVRGGGVGPAVKDDADGRFLAGDAVGFAGDEIVAWGGAGSTLRRTLERLGDGAELVTVFAAHDAPIPAHELPAELRGGAEVEVHRAGQPGWWWLIVAE